MGDLLIQRALSCRDRLAKIRLALPSDPRSLLTDERLEAFISFNIFLLLQDAIAIATSLVADRGLGVPASQRDAFEKLAAAGLITTETAQGMAAATGLRNRIAHTYGEIDPVRMAAEAPQGLDRISRFVDEIVLVIRPL